MPASGSPSAATQRARRGYASVLVLLQFGSLTVLYLHAGPLLSSVFGVALALGAIAAGLWSMASLGRLSFRIHPMPKAGAKLCRHGPYRFVRHPMYSVVLTLGFAVVWKNPAILALASLMVAAVVLTLKLRLEERLLAERFPDYAAYASATPALLPVFLPNRAAGKIVRLALLALALAFLVWRVIEHS